MKTLIIALLIGLAAFAVSGQSMKDRIAKLPDRKEFTAEYDKFKDRTVVSTHIMFRFPKGKISVLECSVKSVFPGETVTKDTEDFYLYFTPRFGRSGWQLLRDQHGIMLVDGERIDLGEGDHDGEVLSRGGVYEYVAFKVTRDIVKKMADAKTLEVQLATFEVEIESKGHPRLASLLSLTSPPK